MIRIIAIILNGIFLCGLLLVLADEGFPSKSKEILLVIFLFVTPIASLLALYSKSNTGLFLYLKLYFKRKAVEEQKRISEIESDL